jgi:hypothetical protein
MNLKNNNYLLLNKEGIFPGPLETENNFLIRIKQLQTSIELPGKPLTQQDWEDAHRLLKQRFDIKPTWVAAFYLNKKLRLWEAAATWECEGNTIIQLRNRFKRGYWGPTTREEVLAHEAAHAARMAFKESRFEEILCYQTSRAQWRKAFGPLFRRPTEAIVCLVGALLGAFFGVFDLFIFALSLLLFPFVFLLLRLRRDQRVFRNCLKNIAPLLICESHSLAVALRLSDREIAMFAHASTGKIIGYVKLQTELRWEVLRASYFISF